MHALSRASTHLLAAAGWATALGFAWTASAAELGPAVNRPIERPADGYVSSEYCRACHPHELSTWHDSYHRTMTQVATPEAVTGRFDGTPLELQGRTVRLERRGETFWMVKQLADGPVEYPIVLTTGSHHMQVYWYATGKTRWLGQVPFVFLHDEQRWIPRLSAFLFPPTALDQDEAGRWNRHCLNCHATNSRPRLFDSGVAKTEVSEFGIACEACHGPAEEHVRVNRDPQRRYELHLGGGSDPSIVNPARLSADRSSQVCGQCHGQTTLPQEAFDEEWSVRGFAFRPGDDLAESGRIVLRRFGTPDTPKMRRLLEAYPKYMDTLYWSDGMVRVTGREYMAFLETPCHTRGELTCLSCHRMHQPEDDPRPRKEWADDQLALGMEGDAACLSCHSAFATDLEGHTHHPAASEGSRCQNCHMPHTTWGLLKAIRSHRIDSPSAASSVETGRPNACNLCHLDRSLYWAADRLEAWYGQAKPDLGPDDHAVAASALWALRGDAGQRALVAWHMGWEPARRASGSDWMAPYLGQLLEDPYDAVRFSAWRSLRSLPGFADFEYDFMGPAGERPAARHRAWQTWQRAPASDARAPRAETLILIPPPSGVVQLDQFRDLLAQRDDRMVLLAE